MVGDAGSVLSSLKEGMQDISEHGGNNDLRFETLSSNLNTTRNN